MTQNDHTIISDDVELKELLRLTEKMEAAGNNSKDAANRGEEINYKEGGWGWVVVIATGYSFGIIIGLINNYALIYNKFDQVYSETENHIFYAAWIGSAATGGQYLFCAIGSVVTDLFGARKIGIIGGLISSFGLLTSAIVTRIEIYFLTYSLIFGLGQALMLTATLAILPHYFNKKLSLANGVMNFVTAIVVVILPLTTSWSLEKYGLRYTFYYFTLLNFLTVLLSFTFKPILRKDKNMTKIQKIKKSFGKEIFKKSKFIIWTVASIVCMFGYLIPVVNIVSYMFSTLEVFDPKKGLKFLKKDHHSIKAFPGHEPMIINVVFGASSGIAAILFGYLGDFTKFNRVHYHTLVFLVYGIVQILIPFAMNFYVLLFQMAILGLMDGVYLCFIVPISFDVSESPLLANHAIGYYHVALTPTTIAGPAFAGKIFEIYQTYDYAFYLGGLTCLIGAVMLAALTYCSDCIEVRQMKKKAISQFEIKT